MEQNSTDEQTSGNNEQNNSTLNQSKTEEVKTFFKNDLLGMVKLFLKEPISGTYSLFANKGNNYYFQSVVLILTTSVLYILIPYVLLGDSRRYIEFSSMIKVGLIPLLFMVVIASISFVTKSISGKADFKSELFTGALNSFPLTLFLLLIAIIVIFTKIDIQDLLNPSQLLNSGVIFIIILFYLILMMINILQQSLKASNTKDALSYYISPVGVLLAWYITFQISKEILF